METDSIQKEELPNEAVQPIGESKGSFRLWLTFVFEPRDRRERKTGRAMLIGIDKALRNDKDVEDIMKNH